MPMFGRRSHAHHTTHSRFLHRRDPDRVAGGYKAALSNPHTTRQGRRHAKHELHSMGRSSHVPFMTKVKRALGIRSTPRRSRHTTTTRRSRY